MEIVNSYLTFPIQENIYAVKVKYVIEVLNIGKITPIPKAQKHIKGVINFRGSILPIMDLRLKLGLQEKPYDDKTVIIVFETKDNDKEEIQLGCISDGVYDVANIKTADILPVNPLDCKINPEYCEGFFKNENRFITILNVEKIFVV